VIILRRVPRPYPAEALDSSQLDDLPNETTYEIRERLPGITKDGEFQERPAQALDITKDGTPVLFQQSQKVKSLAQRFCSHWDKIDYAKCGAVLNKIQKTTTAITFAAICGELDIPTWRHADYYINLYEYERWQRRRDSFDYWSQPFCERGTCGKPLPNEYTFRKIVVTCLKQGFYILDPRTKTNQDLNRDLTADYCICKNEIISRLASIRNRRSRAKRMVAFLAKVAPRNQKSRRFVLQRGVRPKDRNKQKALRRQMVSEDLILWDAELYDSKGKPHCVEDVLDTPLIRRLINGKCGERRKRPLQERVLRVLSQLATDPSLVTTAIAGLRLEPPDPPEKCIFPDVERLWRKRLDDK
jgi:hypothetical protein